MTPDQQNMLVEAVTQLLDAAENGTVTLEAAPQLKAFVEEAAKTQANKAVIDYFNAHEPYKSDREWVHKNAQYVANRAKAVQDASTSLETAKKDATTTIMNAKNSAISAIQKTGKLTNNRLLKEIREHSMRLGLGLGFGTILGLSCIFMLFKMFF